jgi:hypothetical protein
MSTKPPLPPKSSGLPSATASSGAFVVDYVLIGPRLEMDVLVRAFATVGLEARTLGAAAVDPEQTIDIPTAHVQLMRRSDGLILVKVNGQLVAEATPAGGSGKAELRMRSSLLAAA